MQIEMTRNEKLKNTHEKARRSDLGHYVLQNLKML